MAKYWTTPAKYRTPKTSPIQDAPVRQACLHSQAQASTPSSSKTQGRVDDHARVEAVHCVLPRGIPRSLSKFQRRLMRLIAHDALLVPCRCVARTPTAPAGHPCRHSCASSLPSRRHHALWAQSPGGSIVLSLTSSPTSRRHTMAVGVEAPPLTMIGRIV